MTNKTGFAAGRLDPIVYYQDVTGKVALPPDSKLARYYYSEFRDARGKTYRDYGFELREAGTLAEVDALQRRLVAQDRQEAQASAERDDQVSEESWRKRGSDLYARMVSGSTPEYEKEFIRLYLRLREDKRSRHRQRWTERQSYLVAREMDSNHGAADRVQEM